VSELFVTIALGAVLELFNLGEKLGKCVGGSALVVIFNG